MARPKVHDRVTLGAKLCERIAKGELVKDVCKDLKIAENAPFRWATDDPDGFGKLYARAREDQAHALAEQTIAIADDESTDANSRRVRVDTRKWYVSKIAPRLYGEKQQVEHTGPDGSALTVTFRHE